MGKIMREDRIVIKALQVEKNWSSRRFLKEFASKAWCRSSLDRLIRTIDAGLPVDGNWSLPIESLVAVVAGQ